MVHVLVNRDWGFVEVTNHSDEPFTLTSMTPREPPVTVEPGKRYVWAPMGSPASKFGAGLVRAVDAISGRNG